MEKEEKQIEKAVKEGLEGSSIDLAMDYAELGLDAFLDNDAIKEMPIIKSCVGLVKGVLAVKEIFFVKKTTYFFERVS